MFTLLESKAGRAAPLRVRFIALACTNSYERMIYNDYRNTP